MTAQFKLIIYALAFTALMGFFIYQQKASYQSGYDSARAELQSQFLADIDTQMRHKKEQLDNAILESDKWKKKAIELQSRKPVVITETEVQTIVKENNDCKRIIHLPQLLNKLTNENFAD